MSGPATSCTSPDGHRLLTTSGDWRLRMWDSTTGRELPGVPCNDRPATPAFSPDGKRVAAAVNPTNMDERNSLNIFDADTGRLIVPSIGPASTTIDAVAFDPGGRLVARGLFRFDCEALGLRRRPGGERPQGTHSGGLRCRFQSRWATARVDRLGQHGAALGRGGRAVDPRFLRRGRSTPIAWATPWRSARMAAGSRRPATTRPWRCGVSMIIAVF